MQDVEKPRRVLLGNAYPDLLARVVSNKVVLKIFAAIQGVEYPLDFEVKACFATMYTTGVRDQKYQT
jgi:hypothetical protein